MQSPVQLSKQTRKDDNNQNEDFGKLATKLNKIHITNPCEKEYMIITEAMKRNKVSQALFTLRDYELLVEFDKIPKTGSNSQIVISTASLKRVVFGMELNDEAINSYIAILREKSKQGSMRILNSYFINQLSKQTAPLQRIFKKFKIDEQSKLIFPVNLKGNHWITLTVSQGNVDIFDSLKNTGIPPIVNNFFTKYYGMPCDVVVCGNFPKQGNLIDCGMFVLCGISDLILNNGVWTFQQSDMYQKRLEVAKSILYYGKQSIDKSLDKH